MQKAPHISATLFWQGRRDCVASLAIFCFFAFAQKLKFAANLLLFPKNLRIFAVASEYFSGYPFFVRILLPSKKAPHISATLLWQGRRDSNTQPAVLETAALPLSHSPKYMRFFKKRNYYIIICVLSQTKKCHFL